MFPPFASLWPVECCEVMSFAARAPQEKTPESSLTLGTWFPWQRLWVFLARGWDSLWKRTLEPHLSFGWSPAVLWGLTRAPSGLAKPGWTSGAAQLSPVHVTDPRTPAVNGRHHVKPPRSEMVRVQGHNENHSAFERVKRTYLVTWPFQGENNEEISCTFVPTFVFKPLCLVRFPCFDI